MRRFQVDQQIRASTDRIWAVLEDVERWPEWTPTVTRIERLDARPLGVGSRVHIRQPKLRPAIYVVTVWEPEHRFVWEAVSPGVTVVAGHALESREGICTVTLDLSFRGFFGGLAGFLSRGLVERYVRLEADGLKARSEGFPRAGSNSSAPGANGPCVESA